MTLSVQQQAVIDWVENGKGSLQLTARAGCGKTFTLMAVIDTIAKRNLGSATLMAYNKSIANELKAKLEERRIDWRTAKAATVHSLGFSVWKKVANADVKINEHKVRDIIARLANAEAHRDVYRDCESVIAKAVGYAKQRAFGHLVPCSSREAWLDMWDHFGLDEEITEAEHSFSQADILRAACVVYKESLERCREEIDFDDMILAPLYFRCRFWQNDWILVDESQDLNPARRALALAMLKPRTGRMIFVGDDRQAIYGFTGADSDAMDLMRAATAATVLPLTVTRRCPKAVVKLAQRFVPDIEAHEDAPIGSVSEIEESMLFDQNLSKTDAILCRNTAPLISTAYKLIRKRIGCRIEGRDIGTGLIKLARRWKVKRLDALLNKLEEYEARETAKLMSQDKENAIEALKDRLDCLRLIIEECQQRQQHTVNDLVSEISSLFGDTKEGEQAKLLTLSTVHKSKGREWPRVFILGRNRYMPSPYAKKDWQIAQEDNLIYVAITRAQNELVDIRVAPPSAE